jgi:hypothetical protein
MIMVVMVVVMIVVMIMVVMIVVMIMVVVIVIMIIMFVVIYVRGHMTRQTGWGIGVVIAVTGIISRGRSRSEHRAAETNSGDSSESDYDFMKHEEFLQDAGRERVGLGGVPTNVVQSHYVAPFPFPRVDGMSSQGCLGRRGRSRNGNASPTRLQ